MFIPAVVRGIFDNITTSDGDSDVMALVVISSGLRECHSDNIDILQIRQPVEKRYHRASPSQRATVVLRDGCIMLMYMLAVQTGESHFRCTVHDRIVHQTRPLTYNTVP